MNKATWEARLRFVSTEVDTKKNSDAVNYERRIDRTNEREEERKKDSYAGRLFLRIFRVVLSPFLTFPYPMTYTFFPYRFESVRAWLCTIAVSISFWMWVSKSRLPPPLVRSILRHFFLFLSYLLDFSRFSIKREFSLRMFLLSAYFEADSTGDYYTFMYEWPKKVKSPPHLRDDIITPTPGHSLIAALHNSWHSLFFYQFLFFKR